MANYTFQADGVLRPDAIKFYPRDAAGNPVTGVTLEITQGCGSISNVRDTTDNNGVACLVADYTPPTSATGSQCFITARSGTDSICNCALNLEGDVTAIDCSALNGVLTDPVVIGQPVTYTFTLVDGNNVPIEDDGNWTLSTTGITGGVLSYLGGGNYSYTGTSVAANGSIGITGAYGQCTGVTFTAINVVVIDCANIFCQPNADGYVVGQPQTISIFVPDTDGNAITNSADINFEFVGADVTSLPQYNPTNGRWEFMITPTATTVVGSLVSASDQLCPNYCTFSAVDVGVDCSAVTCVYNDARVGETGRADIKVYDTNGNLINTGVSFVLSGATLTAAPAYDSTSGEWMLDFDVTSQTISVDILTPLGNCQGACTFAAGQAPTIDCSTIVCPVADSLLPYVVGNQGYGEIVILDTDGNPVENGVTLVLSGGTLMSSPQYTAGKWGFDFIPNQETVTVTVLSPIGNCSAACTISAVIIVAPEVNCTGVQCIEPSGGFVIGQEATISVYVPDSAGQAVDADVAFDFIGANLASQPIFDTGSGNWVFSIVPTAETIVGSLLTSTLGNCGNFCTLTALPDGNVECCPFPQAITWGQLRVGQSFSGQVVFSDPTVTAVITNLPAGITANGNVLTGTPTTEGTYDILVRTAANCTTTLKVVVGPAAGTTASCCPKFESSSLPTGIVGDPYSGFSVFSGTGARTYSAVGLPPGITLNATTGQFTGDPTQVGNYNIDYTVSDSTGSCQYRHSIDIDPPREVCPAECPRITSLPVLTAEAGSAVNSMITATTTTGNVTFVPVTIATGLNLDTNGRIVGTAPASGNYNFSVEIGNGERSCITQMTFVSVGQDVPAEPGVDSILMTICAGEFDLDLDDSSWTLDSQLPSGIDFSAGKFTGTMPEGMHSIRLKRGSDRFGMILCAKECCESHSEEGMYWVQIIGCATLMGVTYNQSMSCPSDPIQVTKEQRDHLLTTGKAVACQ